MSGIAAFVALVTPWGIALVQEPAKPGKIYWKFPGGAGEGNETPKQCARREFLEEVGGAEIYENDLVKIKEEPIVDERKPWRNHVRHFFRVDKDVVNPKARGDEGEIIRVFRPEDAAEVLARGEMLPGHCEILREILVSLGVVA